MRDFTGSSPDFTMRGKTETGEEAKGFEFYVTLRSYEKVAKEVGKTSRTIKNWAKKHNWQERINLRDIEIAKGLEEHTNKQVINEKAKQLERIQKILDGSATEQNFIIKALNNSMKRDEEGNLVKGKDGKPIFDIKASDPRGLAELARSLVSLRKAETDAMKHQLLLLGEADSRGDFRVIYKTSGVDMSGFPDPDD